MAYFNPSSIVSSAVNAAVKALFEENADPAYQPSVVSLSRLNKDFQRGASVPTVRAIGGALVDGDEWHETTTGLKWLRVGTRWVTEASFTSSATSTSTGFTAVGHSATDNDIRIESFQVKVLTGATNNASNFATVNLDREDSTGNSVGLGISVNTAALGSNTHATISVYPTSGNIIDVSAASIRRIRLGGAINTGAPGTTTVGTGTIIYKFVKP
jgi:hypothetical protein